jgi:5'-deoxynucleotidase YfbR-like HD superfamily hydrolase
LALVTYTGIKFDILNPKIEDINIIDIAHSLSNTCRFGGHCKNFYSVAEHSLLVGKKMHDISKGITLAGLLHDAAEAYIGDVTRPVKIKFPFIEEIESNIRNCIYAKFDLDYSKYQNIIETVDKRVLMTELKELIEYTGEYLVKEEPYTDLEIQCLEPKIVKNMFLEKIAQFSGINPDSFGLSLI